MANKGSMSDKAFAGLSSLIQLLPTGTVFAYQFINPLLIGEGRCEAFNKILSSILMVVCGISCFVSSFTDSFKDENGITHYGIATCKGFWPNKDSRDLSSHKIRFGDFVHAFFALVVFAALALLNDDTLNCFYPSFEKNKMTLLSVLPTVVGVVSSGVFCLFPSTRHYIGYTDLPSQKSKTLNSLSHA